MRRIVDIDQVTQKPIWENYRWGDHYAGCPKCSTVDLEKSATFVQACAEGSPLLAEEMIKRQLPKQKEKEARVREWAKKAGVFKDA